MTTKESPEAMFASPLQVQDGAAVAIGPSVSDLRNRPRRKVRDRQIATANGAVRGVDYFPFRLQP